MKTVELFAGVGGFRLGLERAGHQVVWANEWDRFACDTYDRNFHQEGRTALQGSERSRIRPSGNRSGAEVGGDRKQNARRDGQLERPKDHRTGIDRRDITTVPADDIPVHDLLVGGFPCQAFSVAGKRLGFNERRGTLFFEIARIAEHRQTPYLLLENVKGLLSHDRGDTFETILRTLDKLGYDCQWQVLNSKDFGVPQNRERVFIVGHLRNRPRPQVFPLSSHGLPDSRTSWQAEETSRTLRGGERGLDVDDQLVGVISHGEFRETDQALTLDHSYYKGPDNHGQRPVVYDDYNSRFRTDGLSGTVTANTGSKAPRNGQKAVIEGRIRRLTPVECERLQGFPDNWTAGVSDTQRYKQMGNAVTVPVVHAIGVRLPITAPPLGVPAKTPERLQDFSSELGRR